MKVSIKTLYDQLYKDEQEKGPETIIKRVEQNLSLVDNTDSENSDESKKANKILADYAIALQKTGKNTKSLPFLEKAINRLENSKENSGEDTTDEPLHESLIFHKGLANYSLKKYKEAKPDFKKLVEKDRTKAEYKTMHNETVKMLFRKYEWILVILIVISAAVSIYIGKKNLSVYRISYGALIVVIIGFYAVGYLKKKQMAK